MSSIYEAPEVSIGKATTIDACMRGALSGEGAEVLERSTGRILARLSPMEAGAFAEAFVMGTPSLDPSILEIPRS